MIFYLCKRTVLDLVVSSLVSFRSCQIFFVRTKMQGNLLPIGVFEEAEEAKIWWNPQVQRWTRSLALGGHGSHCNQEEWLKELKDTTPANEAKGQNTTSASCTKLLDNRHDSETSTTRESGADEDVDNVDLKISSFWHYNTWFQKLSEERRGLNSSNIIPMLPPKSSK